MIEKEIRKFNIRVYGLLMNETAQILLSDEYVLDMKMTKFPGGGLIFGEGPEDCIRREAIEEFGQEVEIIGHYYTTGLFQRAQFFDDHQLISIYYKVRLKETPRFTISSVPFDFTEMTNGNQSFRWADISELSENDLSFPIDRYVLKLLQNEYK